jgi:hypothetical protein
LALAAAEACNVETGTVRCGPQAAKSHSIGVDGDRDKMIEKYVLFVRSALD